MVSTEWQNGSGGFRILHVLRRETDLKRWKEEKNELKYRPNLPLRVRCLDLGFFQRSLLGS